MQKTRGGKTARGENQGLEGFAVGNFSTALHQELLFDYKPEIAEKLAGEFDLKT